METRLKRIAELAGKRPEVKFTSLAHLINETTLLECHYEADARKAPGVDQVTKDEYGRKLAENVRDLVERMKGQTYKPQPVRRAYIPKAEANKKRPLGIPTYEDKLVQMAVTKILTEIYEADFLNCSYGFRRKRGCHQALKELNKILESKEINYILDADIRKFFEHVAHEWLMKFLQLRIADPNILRLITRFLKAGVMEAGIVYDTPEGTPQGGVISPLLANVYLHYVLDLWFEKAVKRYCKGEAYLIRYADDFVCCFQYENEARIIYQALIERLKQFNLEIATEKTKIIAFGRRAEEVCMQEGKRRPETFDFLGFTHYCGKSKYGSFRVKRKTSRKKYAASLKRCKNWLRENRTEPVKELMKRLRTKLIGNYRYYGVSWNYKWMKRYRREVERLLFKWLNRRSQKKSFNWEKFRQFKQFSLPEPRIYVNMYG